MDTLKIKLTIDAAIKFLDLLEDAIDRFDYRAVGAAFHNLRRELDLLRDLLK